MIIKHLSSLKQQFQFGTRVALDIPGLGCKFLAQLYIANGSNFLCIVKIGGILTLPHVVFF